MLKLIWIDLHDSRWSLARRQSAWILSDIGNGFPDPIYLYLSHDLIVTIFIKDIISDIQGGGFPLNLQRGRPPIPP